MGVFESVGHSFRHYADFKGRASRSEFWIFFGFVILLNLLANAAEAAAETGVHIGTIMQSPMEGLISYHSEKI